MCLTLVIALAAGVVGFLIGVLVTFLSMDEDQDEANVGKAMANRHRDSE